VAPINSQSRDIHPVAAADTACAFAKQGGSRRVVCYSPDNEDLRQHRAMLAWIPRIRAALVENRLTLYCQPIVPLNENDGKLRFEVLVRMIDEGGRLAPPGEFIPAAEHFGLMPALDLWVVRSTLAWLEAHTDSLGAIAHCGINLSGASIGETDFRAGFQTLLMHTQVPLDRLCFEITETAAIYHLDRVGNFVADLRSLGARAALDDFGVGLSSFGYLKHVPVDYIKIDGSFITHILDNPVDAAMVCAIHDVAQAMGVLSIAEYVENGAIAQHLGAMGIAYGQGWHFGKPLPIDEYFASAAAGNERAKA
jgi:Amt family ammonium transporter